MNFNEYQNLARRTQNKRLNPDERLRHALCGLPSEVGEVCGLFQKVYQGRPLNADKVADEMGDCMWFLAELADVLGMSLQDIAENNIAKLRERYPDGFSAERSNARYDL